MGELIDMGPRTGAPVFRLRGAAQANLTQLLVETGQFPTPPPLDKLFFPVYQMQTLQTLVGGGLLLEPDFTGRYPLHFAMVVLGAVYSKASQATLNKTMEAIAKDSAEANENLPEGEEPIPFPADKAQEAVQAVHSSPMFQAGHSMVQYTMSTMIMRHFSPETYGGERLILVFNPLTDKVELWAGIPLHIEQPTEATPGEPSENPGPAPAEQP